MLRRFQHDQRGLSAVEFAFILPLMLLIFFAMVETTNGVALDRKVSITARTLSDLVARKHAVTDADITDSFRASLAILMPYSASPVTATISELKIDKDSKVTVVWSKGWTTGGLAAGRPVGDVTLPAELNALKAPNTYLIWSEVKYLYMPAVPYLMEGGVTLSDQSVSHPRRAPCVLYKTTSCS